MKYRRGALALSLGMAAMGLLAPARAANQDVRQELEANYTRLDQAAVAKDKGPILQFHQEMTTSDFQVAEIKPRRFILTRQELLHMMDTEPWEPSTTQKMWITHLTVRGNRATALVGMRATGPSKNPKWTRDASGKTHEFVSSGRSRDTWVKTPAGWKLRRVVVLRDNTTMDGKPYTPPSPEVIKGKSGGSQKPQ